MGKPRRLVAEPPADIVVEYVHGRRVMRLVNQAGGRREVVEMSLDSFLSGLGLEAADLTPARHYLLFASTGSGGAGGLRDLHGAFDSEKRARDAFRNLRMASAFSGGWAELLAVQPGRRIVPVCWFGRAASDPTHWDHRAADETGKRLRSRRTSRAAVVKRRPFLRTWTEGRASGRDLVNDHMAVEDTTAPDQDVESRAETSGRGRRVGLR